MVKSIPKRIKKVKTASIAPSGVVTGGVKSC